ncbi:MAG: hypothetical protein ACK4MG_14445 [Aquabacterium sp.]
MQQKLKVPDNEKLLALRLGHKRLRRAANAAPHINPTMAAAMPRFQAQVMKGAY